MQRKYVETIQQKDIVFGIGPAGTGKTYLGVAMAVQALMQKQVNRIVLARPAVEAGEKLGFLPATCRRKSILICVLFTTRCSNLVITSESRAF